MKKEKKNIYKIVLDVDASIRNNLSLVKLKGYETLSLYNSSKFARIIANKIVFINRATCRILNKFNPHIAKDLEDANCIDWRVDELGICREIDNFAVRIDKRAEYKVNFDTGEITRELGKNEAVCKHCHSVVDQSEIVGAFCENCLTETNGLAYRFSYHSFGGPYTIYEKKVNQQKTALFGIEIERDYLLGYNGNFEDDLHRATIGAVKTIYGNKLNNLNVKRKAVFMRDGSLSLDGIEWITFPQSYKAFKKDKDKLNDTLRVLKKYNFGNSKKVGNHIHINRKFFGDMNGNKDESRYAGAKMALLLNEFWEEFIAISKRKETGYTEKPVQNKKDKIFSLIEKTINNERAHGVAVNLEHNDTIEIRIWAGIDTAEDLLLFIDLTQALATFAKRKSLESCQRAKFTDILKLLTDKKEHLTEIKKRLHKKDITKYDDEIKEIIKSEVR